MSAQQRTAAAMPPAGHSRPSALDPGTLCVTYSTEDGDTRTYDFGSIDAPKGVVEPLAAAFAIESGPSGSWQRDSSVQSGWETTKRFMLFIADEHPDAAAVSDLTADVWAHWLDSTKTPSGDHKNAYMMRTLLRGVEGLPARTRMALNGFLSRRARRQEVAYRRREVARIVSAARRTLRTAETRIAHNLAARDLWRDGSEPPDAARVRLKDCRVWSHGEVVDHLSRTGRMPAGLKGTPAPRSSVLRDALGLAPGAPSFRPALYLTVHEVYAAMILLVHAKGLNVSVMARVGLGDITSQPGLRPGRQIHTVAVQKPRRGAVLQPPETFSGASARLLERILEMTQPARDTLAELGHPEDRLLVAALEQENYSRHPSGLFATNWHDTHGAVARWHKQVPVDDEHGEPIRVSLRRLRLTMQVIRGEAMGNSLPVSVNTYRGPDPQTHEQARPVVLRGLHDALDDAQQRAAALVTKSEAEDARTDPATLAARLGISKQHAKDLIDGRLDTATAACLDIMHSPHPDDQNGPCTMSWLTCVQCPNAVVTPDHLPRVVATRDALAEAAQSAPPARAPEYAGHAAAFEDLLHSVPEPELRRARATVTATDIERATSLLSRRLDA